MKWYVLAYTVLFTLPIYSVGPLDRSQQIIEFNRLWQAALRGSLAEVKKVLNSGVDINVKFPSIGDTVLHRAAREGNLAAVKILVENGAYIDARNLQTVQRPPHADDQGRTPLHVAAARHRLDIVKYLVEEGANMHVIDSYNNTPLDLAKQNKKVTDRLATIKYLEDKMRQG